VPGVVLRRATSSSLADTGFALARRVTSILDAIPDLVREADTVAIEGFTHLTCFAAGHDHPAREARAPFP
jgi:hypothetical protein